MEMSDGFIAWRRASEHLPCMKGPLGNENRLAVCALSVSTWVGVRLGLIIEDD